MSETKDQEGPSDLARLDAIVTAGVRDRLFVLQGSCAIGMSGERAREIFDGVVSDVDAAERLAGPLPAAREHIERVRNGY